MSTPHLAALAVKLPSTGNTIQLLPAGVFRSWDGRPESLSGWKMDSDSAAKIIAELSARDSKVAIDYEHQSLKAQENGQPAPAAGWFKNVEWREGAGLYATDVEWTEKARTMIQNGEYLYISPVIAFNRETGAVTQLRSAALTNTPALGGMDEVTALVAEVTADPVAALRSFMEGLQSAGAMKIADQVEAMVRETQDALTQLRDQVAATHHAQGQVSALSRQIRDQRISAVLETAKIEGRLLPYQVEAARKFAESDLEALSTLLHRPAIVPIGTTQTDEIRRRGGQLGVDATVAALTQEERHVCALTGRSPQEFATLKAGFADEDPGLID